MTTTRQTVRAPGDRVRPRGPASSLILSLPLLTVGAGPAWGNSGAGNLDCDRFPAQRHSEYVLPYAPGSTFRVTNTTGHFTPSNGGVGLHALDFAMPIRTPVHAVRAGEVVAVRERFRDGNGVDLEENFVFIRHADGTVARYFHLTRDGSAVEIGDRVSQGELIGWSGNTGQTAGPHLHFDVQQCGPNLPPNYNALPCGRTLPVSFRNTQAHGCGLRLGVRYEALPIGAKETNRSESP